jgi:hypothetical protein
MERQSSSELRACFRFEASSHHTLEQLPVVPSKVKTWGTGTRRVLGFALHFQSHSAVASRDPKCLALNSFLVRITNGVSPISNTFRLNRRLYGVRQITAIQAIPLSEALCSFNYVSCLV